MLPHRVVVTSSALDDDLGYRKISPKSRNQTWLLGPQFSVGVMLLVFLGIEGERIDVGAHIAGFFTGCLLGAGLVVTPQNAMMQRRVRQCAFGAVAHVLFAGAWLIALSGALQTESRWTVSGG